jgi:ABC-type bacteriocin/lantibiotic exporter with double-glycine peptidase domain
MEEIYKICEEKTLIVIAHRLSTIEGCEIIYKLEKNQIIEISKIRLTQQMKFGIPISTLEPELRSAFVI